jgi:hypothetical protein
MNHDVLRRQLWLSIGVRRSVQIQRDQLSWRELVRLNPALSLRVGVNSGVTTMLAAHTANLRWQHLPWRQPRYLSPTRRNLAGIVGAQNPEA